MNLVFGFWMDEPDETCAEKCGESPGEATDTVHEVRVSAGAVGQDDAEHEQGNGSERDVSEKCGNAVALFDSGLEREGDGHAEDEEEAGEDHIHISHHIDLAGGVIGPPGQTFYLCELVDEDHERDVESAKNVKRNNSM